MMVAGRKPKVSDRNISFLIPLILAFSLRGRRNALIGESITLPPRTLRFALPSQGEGRGEGE